MNQTQQFSHPDLVYSMELPADWNVDIGGISNGLVMAAAPEPWSMGFHPNITMTHARLGPDDAGGTEAAMAAQRAAERSFVDTFEDYRLLHLDYETFGTTGDDAAQVPGVMRVAYYTNPEGVPLMMHQWAARHAGVEVSMTVTFAAADLPDWSRGSWSLASLLRWKEAAP